MENTRNLKEARLGDAAVEGLLNGILAGVVMALFILLVELFAGVAPLAVLGAFDASNVGSPLVGVLSHLAVAGVYGVVFGMLALLLVRVAGSRVNRMVWLVLGAAYGLLIFAIAEWIILPRTNSALSELPVWAFASAHLFYGIVVAWLWGRNK
jgi:hypothetical protein